MDEAVCLIDLLPYNQKNTTVAIAAKAVPLRKRRLLNAPS